jgi:hypothetical protein
VIGCRRRWLVQGGRARKRAKNPNYESMKPMKLEVDGRGHPSSLRDEPVLARIFQGLSPSETRAKAGGWVGATGFMRAMADEMCRIRPLKRVAARLGPPWPTFAHIDFLPSRAWNEYWKWSAGVLESWANQPARWWVVDLCGKSYGLLRIVTRSFTKVRTDQGRGYAIVRIFTGGTNFSIRKAGNEENKNRKEGGLTTDGHR